MSDPDDNLRMNNGRAAAVAFTDSRHCHIVTVSPTEIYYCYHKYAPNQVTDIKLSDAEWQILLSDGAGGTSYPATPGENGGYDPGYNYSAADPASITFFVPIV